MKSKTPARIKNFGRNVSFRVANHVRVGDEAEVLALLNEKGAGNIRVAGARHSWNTAFATRDTLIDLSRLNSVKHFTDPQKRTVVSVGGGCSVNELLDYLGKKNLSIQGYGIIGKQSIAGAVSTATHGSGHSSLSNQVLAAHIAAYDDRGEPTTHEFGEQDESLEAARCAFGCMGIILSLTLVCENRPLVSERTSKSDSLTEMLAEADSYPLQQFYLVPFAWKWYAQLRKTVDKGRSSPAARRWYYFRRFWKIEILFNLCVKLLANIPGLHRLFPAFFRQTYAGLRAENQEFTDHADKLLMMKDDLFRHVEMELFVATERLPEAASFVEGFLRWCAGETPDNFGAISQIVSAHGDKEELAGLKEELAGLKGTYLHHYPITFRRVLKDDTMMSMTHDGEAYAISFINYSFRRVTFETAMRFLASVMAAAFGARPHWGKWMPLDGHEIQKLYPRLEEFREQCETIDKDGVFRNRFIDRKLWVS